MTDLEDRLRVMLRERAQDVTTVPDFVSTLPATRRRASSTPLLVAAAVVAVLAVTLGTVLLHGPRHTTAPSNRHTSAPIRPPIPVSHAPRRVALAWFGMPAVAGFDLHFRSSEPGRRTVGLRARADHDFPVGCNGCSVISDVVVVFDAGAFDANRYGVTGWTRDRVGGTQAYRGSMAWFGVRSTRVPTLAWQFAPRRWALVQGVTPYGGRRATLRALATAVRPTASVPILLPFRLRYVPNLPIVRVDDDVAGGYATAVSFGNPLGTQFAITLWPGKKSFAGLYDSTRATSLLVGGLPGLVGPDGVAARYHDGVAIMGLGDQTPTLSPALQRENARIAAGVEWTNGDGRAPYLAAENAIP